MTATTNPFVPGLFNVHAVHTPKSASSLALCEIMSKVYDPETLHLVMPYDIANQECDLLHIQL